MQPSSSRYERQAAVGGNQQASKWKYKTKLQEFRPDSFLNLRRKKIFEEFVVDNCQHYCGQQQQLVKILFQAIIDCESFVVNLDFQES